MENAAVASRKEGPTLRMAGQGLGGIESNITASRRVCAAHPNKPPRHRCPDQAVPVVHMRQAGLQRCNSQERKCNMQDLLTKQFIFYLIYLYKSLFFTTYVIECDREYAIDIFILFLCYR